MTKCVVTIGYKNFVLDADKALKVVEMLGDAEVYEEKWHSETKENTFHIYTNEGHATSEGIRMELKMLSNGFYQMAKLAGKPKKES